MDHGERANEREAELEKLAAAPEPGLARDFLDFLRHRKRWWLAPILLALLLLGLLVVLSGTGAAPWIYPLM